MPDRATASAPGRVNLIGEHTDYHDGYVLPTVIPQRTEADVERRADRRVRATTDALPSGAADYEIGREVRSGGWLDYVQGVTSVLSREGVALPGFDLRLVSSVPVGAGVSSSAALEISLLRALRALLTLPFDDVQIARFGQRVETEFVGAPVGIMDQMASSLGRDGEALLIDTRSLAVERVPIPSSIEIVVIDSGVHHAHAAGPYIERRRESFEAAALLGVARLRELDRSSLGDIARLPAVLARRARHVVTENQRVLEAAAALRAGDDERLGELFAASQASMRDDYEISTPEIDLLVELATRHPAVSGARMTGGGFGGAVVLLVRQGASAAAARDITEAYRIESGLEPRVLIPPAGRISSGA